MNLKEFFTYSEVQTLTVADIYGEPKTATLRVTNKNKVIKHAAVAVATAVLLLTCWPIKEVPTGHRGVYTMGGRITGVTGEGYGLVFPFIQKLSIFSIRPEAATVEGAEGATADTQPVKVSLTVRYAIKQDKVAEVFENYSHDGNLYSYVDTATREAFKAVTAQYTATELISKRADVSNKFRSAIQEKMSTYFANIVSVDVTSFLFSESYMQAINSKVTEEQKKLAAENRAKTSEAEQRIKIVTAEAEATALKVKADGEAYANLKIAQAQADSLRVQNAALAQNKDVLELRKIEVQLEYAKSWNGVLPTAIYGSAPIPFLDVSKQFGSPTPRNQ